MNKKLTILSVITLFFTLIFSGLLFSSFALAEDKTTEENKQEEVDVRVLATTDLHTNLVNYDYYQDKTSEKIGLAKTAVLIEEAKKENANTLLVDNGDTIQGTPLGTYKATVNPVKKGELHPMYKALETLNYDAGTLGNHEFNYGLDYLDTVLSSVKMPIVNANVLDAKTKEYKYQPYAILNKTYKTNTNKDVNLKIGITGIVPPQIMLWDKANLEGKVIVEDSIKALEKIVPVLKQNGADLVVVLSHSGIGDDKYEEGEENIAYHIPKIEGVDAIVTGHSHAMFPTLDGKGSYDKLPNADWKNGKIFGKPVVMAGKYGDNLGIIDLKLQQKNGKWSVVDSKGFLRAIDSKSTVADQKIIDGAKEAHEGTISYVRQKVGETTAPITSYFSLVKDDPSIQIVNNAQLWYAKKELANRPEGKLPILSAAAPFKAGTRGDSTAYTDIPKGSLAIKNIADLYLYDNVTAIVKVTGVQLKEWLEMSAGQFNTVDKNSKDPQDFVSTTYRTYNFDVIDGVNYKIDITEPNKYDHNGNLVNADANRIKDLQYNGKPIDLNQEFIVVTNNYRMSGNFPGVKDASHKELLNLENRQVIINYLTTEKSINPTADNNWMFADTIKELDLRFITAEKAKELVGSDKDVQFLSAGENGFGNYKFNYVVAKTENKETDKKEEDKKSSQQESSSQNLIPQTEDENNNDESSSKENNNNKQQSGKVLGEKILPKTGMETNNVVSVSFVLLVATALLRRKIK